MSGYLWKVGDLAVCVDDGPPRYLDGIIETNREYVENLRKGRTYRVTIVVSAKTQPDVIGLGFKADRAGGFADRFRPIQPADTEFTQSMRALRPRVEA